MDGLRDAVTDPAPSSIRYIEKFFYGHKTCMERELINQRSPVQIGMNSDPLQPIEKQYKITLRVLRILQDRQYPTVLTTKFPHALLGDEYLRVLDGLPLAVQCSISTEDQALLSRLEPVAQSWKRRLAALEQLSNAGVHVILRLWPYIPDLCGNIEYLLGCAKDAGVKTVQCNHLKLYSPGGGRKRINEALGYNYQENTPCHYEHRGVFKIASLAEQREHILRLEEVCRELDLDLLTCDDLAGTRNWRDCCGVGALPGFKPSPWAYYVRGHVIKEHCSFEEYMEDMPCPYREEFEQEWRKGRLSRAVPELIFHTEDETYSRMR